MTYRKAILIYAYAIPAGLAFVLALILLIVPAKFSASQQTNRDDYTNFLQMQKAEKELNVRMKGKQELAAAWQKALSSEFTTSLNNFITSHLKTLDGSQLEQVSTSQAGTGGGLSLTQGQPASRIILEFRGGYEPMQTTLLAMESQLPQMQLESIEIAEDTLGPALRYALTYTAWEKSAK